MKKKLFKTLFADQKDNYYPYADGENSNSQEKNFSIALAYIFYKKLYNKEPANTTLASFWKKLESYGLKLCTFDQATASRNNLLKKLKDKQFELDFWLLKDWEIKIKEQKSLLIKEISSRLKEFDDNYMSLLELLKNNEIVYCSFLENIKENIADLKNAKNSLSDIYEFLDIDFDLIKDFLKKADFDSILPDKDITEKKLVQESLLIPLQQDLSALSLIQEKWQPLIVSSSNQFVYSFSNDLKGDFQKIQNYFNKNMIVLNGKEGSGKSFLALYLSLGALRNNFCCKFVSVDTDTSIEKIESEIHKFLHTNSEKNNFIVIDGITNLNLNLKSKQIMGKIISFIDNLTNNISGNNYILFTANHHSLLYQKVFSETLLEDFNIFRINDLIDSSEWVTTIMEKVLLQSISKSITSNFNLYYLYLMKVIEINAIKLDLDKNDLQKLFGKIAFRNLMGKPKVADFKVKQKIADFLYYNPICKADRQNMDTISFNHDIFKDILAAEYLLHNPGKAKYLWKKNNFREDKWRVLFKYLSERLDGSNIENFIENPLVIRGIIFHLRRLRELAKAEEFISYIIDNEQKEIEKNYLIIENAKKFYSKYGNYQKCLQTLLEINNPAFEPELYYEYIIQVSSCTLDLFLPVTTVKLINLYLENNAVNDPRLYGNLFRAFLRCGDYNNAKKYLMKKLNTHKKNNNFSDENRDKVDLILIKAFEYGHIPEYSLYKEALELAEETLNFYNLKEKQEEISYAGDKAFIYRNLSYFLVYLNQIKAEELINQLREITETNVTEKAPMGIIFANLACYYYLNSNLSEALIYVNKAIKYLATYDIELCFVYSLHYLLIREKDSKALAIEHYKNFEQNVLFTQNWLTKHLQINQQEKVSLSINDFETKKLSLLNFSIF